MKEREWLARRRQLQAAEDYLLTWASSYRDKAAAKPRAAQATIRRCDFFILHCQWQIVRVKERELWLRYKAMTARVIAGGKAGVRVQDIGSLAKQVLRVKELRKMIERKAYEVS